MALGHYVQVMPGVALRMDPRGPIFNDPAAQIQMTFNDGLDYVECEGICGFWIIGIDF